MKKAKTKTSAKARKNVAAVRKPADLAEVRQKIANLVGAHAVSMVQTAIAEADKGHYAAMKYLFEMAGLYPVTGESEEKAPGENVLAATLLRRLQLPEGEGAEAGVTKGIESHGNGVGKAEADAVE